MKTLLVRFFQVLCLLFVFGHNQLNAHPGLGSLNTAPATQFKDAHANDSQLQGKSPFKINSYSFSQKKDELVPESLDEEDYEYEQAVCKKDLENNHSFTFFHMQLPEYLHHNTQNSLAFCKQLSFTSVNNRHVIFQIFRI